MLLFTFAFIVIIIIMRIIGFIYIAPFKRSKDTLEKNPPKQNRKTNKTSQSKIN